jgi:hypothetical protein
MKALTPRSVNRSGEDQDILPNQRSRRAWCAAVPVLELDLEDARHAGERAQQSNSAYVTTRSQNYRKGLSTASCCFMDSRVDLLLLHRIAISLVMSDRWRSKRVSERGPASDVSDQRRVKIVTRRVA